MTRTVVRRRASLDTQDVEIWCQVEFARRDRGNAFDLTPSVYRVGNEDVLRVHTEHAAGAGLSPPREGLHVDLDGLGAAVADTPGCTP